jgi:acyl-coenzyme A thioesterase 13
MFKEFIGKEAKDVSPSPFGRWLNGKLVAVEKGSMTIELVVREAFTNPAGIMHGGVIDTLGNTGFYVAINLNIDFLRPGKLGEKLTIISEVIREGRTMAHAECKVYNEEGKLIAKAASNLALTNR